MSIQLPVISIDDLYRRRGFLSANGEPRPLHRVCAHRDACWQSAESRYPPDDDSWSHIARPWVGSDYPKLGLLAVGENLNGYGGLDALCDLAEEAKDLIVKGFRRVRFHSTFAEYAGSFLWHRLGCYVAAVAEAHGITSFTWDDDGYPLPRDVARAFDLMAFVEHVKCSPREDKSRPTGAMWERCGAHVLREEIRILKPTFILALGKSTNARHLEENVFDSGYESLREIGQVRRAFAHVGDLRVSVLVVPHPQAYGGAAASILGDLKRALAA